MLIDASVALKWFLPEDDSDRALALVGAHSLAAPELVVAETANGLWKALQRGVIDSETYHENLSLLCTPFDRLEPVEPLVVRAGAIAEELGHPIYNCFYLAATQALGDVLATADKRLLARVTGTRFETCCLSLSAIMT